MRKSSSSSSSPSRRQYGIYGSSGGGGSRGTSGGGGRGRARGGGTLANVSIMTNNLSEASQKRSSPSSSPLSSEPNLSSISNHTSSSSSLTSKSQEVQIKTTIPTILTTNTNREKRVLRISSSTNSHQSSENYFSDPPPATSPTLLMNQTSATSPIAMSKQQQQHQQQHLIPGKIRVLSPSSSAVLPQFLQKSFQQEKNNNLPTSPSVEISKETTTTTTTTTIMSSNPTDIATTLNHNRNESSNVKKDDNIPPYQIHTKQKVTSPTLTLNENQLKEQNNSQQKQRQHYVQNANRIPKTVKLMAASGNPPSFGSRYHHSYNHHQHHHHYHHMKQSFEICMEQCYKILSEQQDYFVIGILGEEGVGKSFTMSSLVQPTSSTNKSNKKIGIVNKIVSQIFQQQSMNNLIEQKYETHGIDMYIYSSNGTDVQNSGKGSTASLGVILLDTQPLFSSSFLNDLISKDAKLDPDIMSYENYVDLFSTQIGLFLFSICHVVLVLQDSFENTKMLKLVQTLRMLQKGIPNIVSQQLSVVQQPVITKHESSMVDDASSQTATNATTTTAAHSEQITSDLHHQKQQPITAITNSIYLLHEYIPELVFVYNKIDTDCISPYEILIQQQFLDSFFSNTHFHKNGYVRPPQISKFSGEGHVNFFVLPFVKDHISNPDEVQALKDIFRHFRNQIFSMPKIKWSKSLSEKDWLQNATKVWDLIQKSHFIAEYNRSFQKLQFYKT